MTTVFHAWPYGRFIEIKSNLRRKKLHRTSQGSNLLTQFNSNSNRDNGRIPIQFRIESQPSILKDDFFLITDSSIFTSIASALLDWSNKPSWVFQALKSTSHFFPQSTVFGWSHSSSEATSSSDQMPCHT